MKRNKVTTVLGIYGLVFAVTIACTGAKTIAETATEEEFNEIGFEYADEQFTADFQPGKIVLTGEVEGQEAIIELGAEVVNGEAAFKLLSITMGGQELGQDLFEQADADLSAVFHTPEEGYAVTDVTITDDEMTVTSTRQ
jgi:hypothetical protein